jgi:thioredoxin-like negative regulator of GroEL
MVSRSSARGSRDTAWETVDDREKTDDEQEGRFGDRPVAPKLVVFLSGRSGASRRAEGFLAQVLQRRRNHKTFQIYHVDIDDRPDLAERFGVTIVPSLAVVIDNKLCGRLEKPRGCREIEAFLKPWLH